MTRISSSNPHGWSGPDVSPAPSADALSLTRGVVPTPTHIGDLTDMSPQQISVRTSTGDMSVKSPSRRNGITPGSVAVRSRTDTSLASKGVDSLYRANAKAMLNGLVKGIAALPSAQSSARIKADNRVLGQAMRMSDKLAHTFLTKSRAEGSDGRGMVDAFEKACTVLPPAKLQQIANWLESGNVRKMMGSDARHADNGASPRSVPLVSTLLNTVERVAVRAALRPPQSPRTRDAGTDGNAQWSASDDKQFRADLHNWVGNVEKAAMDRTDPFRKDIVQHSVEAVFRPPHGSDERRSTRDALGACTNSELLRVAKAVKTKSAGMPSVVSEEMQTRIAAATWRRDAGERFSGRPNVNGGINGSGLQKTAPRNTLHEQIADYARQPVESQAETLRQMAGSVNTLKEFAALLDGPVKKPSDERFDSKIDDISTFVAEELGKMAAKAQALDSATVDKLSAAFDAMNVYDLPAPLVDRQKQLKPVQKLQSLGVELDNVNDATAGIEKQEQAERACMSILGDLAETAATSGVDGIREAFSQVDEYTRNAIRQGFESGPLAGVWNALSTVRESGLFELSATSDSLAGGFNLALNTLRDMVKANGPTSTSATSPTTMKDSLQAHVVEHIGLALPNRVGTPEQLGALNAYLRNQENLATRKAIEDRHQGIDSQSSFVTDFPRLNLSIDGDRFVHGKPVLQDASRRESQHQATGETGSIDTSRSAAVEAGQQACLRLFGEGRYPEVSKTLNQALTVGPWTATIGSIPLRTNDGELGTLRENKNGPSAIKLERQGTEIIATTALTQIGRGFAPSVLNGKANVNNTSVALDENRSRLTVIAQMRYNEKGQPEAKALRYGYAMHGHPGMDIGDPAAPTPATEREKRIRAHHAAPASI